MPKFTEEILKKCTVKELKGICSNYHIKLGKKFKEKN